MSVIVNGNTYLPSADGKIYGQYPAGDAPVGFSYGLLWSDGVEPVNSTLYDVQDGNRIWYVDFDGANGDGSESTPYNSFTEIFGYFDGISYHSGTAGFAAGDHVWVRGTGDFANQVNGTTNYDIQIRRANQLGTRLNPTVVRAWRGYTVSIDGNGDYVRGVQTNVTNLTSDQALVLINLEYHTFEGCPIHNEDDMEYMEVISCNVHDVTVDGASAGDANKGGITVRSRDNTSDRVVRNCRVYDTDKANAGGRVDNDNVSAIRLQGAQGLGGGDVSMYSNEIVRSSNGLGDKHTGTCTVNNYYNYIDDVSSAYYNRQCGVSDFHHNIIVNADEATKIVRETEAQARNLTVRKNTVVDTNLLINVSSGEINVSTVSVKDNIHSVPARTDETYFLGFLSEGFTLTNFSASNNLYETNNNSDFVFHENLTYGFSSGKTLINDTSTIALGIDPLFTDRGVGNYFLLGGSPAINAASDGNNIGAL